MDDHAAPLNWPSMQTGPRFNHRTIGRAVRCDPNCVVWEALSATLTDRGNRFGNRGSASPNTATSRPGMTRLSLNIVKMLTDFFLAVGLADRASQTTQLGSHRTGRPACSVVYLGPGLHRWPVRWASGPSPREYCYCAGVSIY